MQGYPNQPSSTNYGAPGYGAPPNTGLNPGLQSTGGQYTPSNPPGGWKPQQPGGAPMAAPPQGQPPQPPVGMMQRLQLNGPGATPVSGPRPMGPYGAVPAMRPGAAPQPPPAAGMMRPPPSIVGGGVLGGPMGPRPPQTPGPQLANGNHAPPLATPMARPPPTPGIAPTPMTGGLAPRPIGPPMQRPAMMAPPPGRMRPPGGPQLTTPAGYAPQAPGLQSNGPPGQGYMPAQGMQPLAGPPGIGPPTAMLRPPMQQQQQFSGPPGSAMDAYPSGPPPMQMQGGQPPSFGGAPPPAPAPAPGQSMSRAVDPTQMPRPPTTRLPVQVFETRLENTHNIPPPCESPIQVKDNGSAGPRYMRSTLNAVPASADLLKATSLPLIISVNPLALPHQGDTPVEIIDMGSSGPLRCSQCKAYVNPYMRIVDNGRRMQCCFCGALSEVSSDAFSTPHAWQDPSGGQTRPELCRGSVEFVATAEYMVRPPALPTFLFVIDVSAPAIGSGATASVCASIGKLLDELPGGDRTLVGIVTFDNSVHFYSIQPSAERPRMLVMADVDEPYNPLGTQAVVNVAECKTQLVNLLASIPVMFAQNQVPENCGGAAIATAVQALKAGVGGRAVLFISSIPHKGALGLKPREAGRPPTERDALDIMTPYGGGYAGLANDAAENQVSIDVVALAQGYVDLATLSQLSTTTCGSVLRYTPFTPSADAAPLHNDLRWSLVRPQGMEAVGRLRVSSGLSVEKYVGSFYKRSLTDVNLPAVHCDMSIAARVVHDEKLAEGTDAYFQFALLYTTTEGQRRVRVHTLALPVTRNAGTAFRGADMDSYLSYVARKVSAQIPGRSLIACREVITKAAVETLLAYRKQCANASSSGQLILPEALKLLPLYTLGLTKLPCFRTDARADARAMWMARLLSMPADKTVPLVHPRLLPLHDLPIMPEGAPLPTPDSLWLSAEKLEPNGVYLMENGYEAYVYVGAGLPPDLCAALLGVPAVEAVDAARVPTLPVLDTPMNKIVHRLLDEIRRQRYRYMRLRVLRRGDPSEAAFLASLIEDRSPSAGMSYVEFLCHLHRQIQNKLS